MPGSSFGEVIRLIRSALDGSGFSGLSDAQLLEQFFTERDERAFAVLVERHGPMVFSVCRRIMGGVHQSEDAFQAAFLVLIRKTTSLAGKKSVGSWLHGVARRVALRARAQSALRRQKESEAAVMSSTGPLDQLTLQELRSVLDEEIASLSEKYQGPIVLCHLEGKTYDEAANELGCTKITLSRRLTKARALLRTKLERRGITLSLATLATALTEAAQASPLPAFLALNAVKAATLVATGKTAAGGCLSAGALALAEEALAGMLLAKGKLVVMVMALGLAVSGAGWAGYKVVAETSRPAINAQTVGQKMQVEVKDKEEPGVARDQFGDPLPAEAIARIGTTRFWCGDSGRQVVYSSDGSRIVAATRHEVIVLDSITGKQIRRIRPSEGSGVQSFSLSLADKLLAVGTIKRGLQIFDVATGNFLRECTEPDHQQYLDVCFSPDGKSVASWSYPSKSIHIWNPESGNLQLRLPIAFSEWACFTFSKNSKNLIIGDGPNIHFLDAVTGMPTQPKIAHPGVVYQLTLSRDGKTLASREKSRRSGELNDKIHLWDVTTGKKQHVIAVNVESKKMDLAHFDFSPDGKEFFTSSNDRPDGIYPKGLFRVWDLDTAKMLRQFEMGDGIDSFSFAPDGKTMAIRGLDNVVRLWNPTTGREVLEHPGHRYAYRSSTFAVSTDGQKLASGIFAEPDVRLWDLGTGHQNREFKLESFDVLSLYFSVDGGTLITLGRNKELVFWDRVSGQRQRQLKAPIEGKLDHSVLSQDGKIFASVERNDGFDHNKIILWEAATGKKIAEVGDLSQILELSFSPDTRSVYSWDRRTIYVWDIATAKLSRKSPAGDKQIYRGRFSPDGKWFVCGGQAGNILLYDMATGTEVRRVDISGELEAGPSFSYSPDGRSLSVGVDDGSIHLLELATGKLRYNFTGGHQAAVTALIFTPDGQRLVSGSADTTALVWDLTGRLKTKSAPLTSSDIVASWSDLKSDDAARAYQAIRRFAAVPGQTLPFLDKNLLPVAAPDGKTIANHLADLESEIFAKRNAAMMELTKLGELAEPALSLALDKAPTLETRNRIKQLLDRLPSIGTSGEPLRQARAVEVLENIGNPQARLLLEKLAVGAPQANLTRDARATLERLRPR